MPKKENGNFTEAELRAFTGEVPVASESKKQTEQSGLSPVTIRSTVASPLAEATGDEQGEESLFPAVREDAELSPTSVPSPMSDTSSTTVRRISSKQRKLSLDEYRATFLQVPFREQARLCFRNPKTTLPALSDGTNPFPTVADFRVWLLK